MPGCEGPARQAVWETVVQPAADQVGALASFGYPIAQQTFQIVLLGLSTPTEQIVLVGPGAARDQVFGIELLVFYHDPGAAQGRAAEVDQLAWSAADSVRDLVGSNINLRRDGETKGTVNWAYVSSMRSQGTGFPSLTKPNERPVGLLCEIEITVACNGRAT